MTNILSTIMNFPMGSTGTGRWYNGLILGGAAVLVLWLVGVIAF